MIDTASQQSWIGVANAASAALKEHTRDGASAAMRQFLVVRLDETDYAIEVERVREIVRMRDLTPLPRTPDWILGVVALRGEVVEVVDLRRCLHLPPANPSASSRIVVLRGDEDRTAAVLVDAVREVFRVSDDEIVPADALDLRSVTRMCRREGGFVSILDVDRALEFDHG